MGRQLTAEFNGEWVRLPIAPFQVLFRARYATSSARAIEHQSGVARNTVLRGRKRGVGLGVADRLAASLGLHILEIWPDAYDMFDRRAAERQSRKAAHDRRYEVARRNSRRLGAAGGCA